ncbi:cache domain-containing sensor histidine kinase [Paenibacillus sp. GXUN7292]|uniref:cache domain-containing sensor histidine kinase n=1 Tax=Paenibacillus sp. GXUN7292 TaxID=3422499 RepID=UPI003D7E448F
MKRMGSLTFKLFIICLTFAFLCVAIISHLSSNFVRNQASERDQEFINQILLKTNEYLTLTFSSMNTILYSVESFIDSNANNELQLGKYLDSLYDMNLQAISNVYVIEKDFSIIGGRTITRVVNDPMPELEQIYNSTREKLYSTSVSEPYYNRFSGWTVTMSRVAKSNSSLVIAVDLNFRELERKLLQIHEEEKLQLYIIDIGGGILASSRQDTDKIRESGQILNIPIEDIISHPDSRWFNSNETGAEDLIIKKYASEFNWLLTAVSDGSRLMQTLEQINQHFIRLFLLGLILSLVVAFMITRYIRKPVLFLTQQMRRIEHGNLEVQMSLNRKDEFGYLSQKFDSMLRQISELFNRVKEQTEQQKKLEIQVLQSQINPHFLYNTLGAISNVVRLGQTDKVDPVIGSLIAILEYGIKDPSHKVPLLDELRNARDYLSIQNIRYNREFKLVEQIEESLLSFKVFRMFLQPIVENSIFHGYRGGQVEGEVHIRAYCEEQNVVIEVRDKGIGISEEDMGGLLLSKEETDSDQRKRIGLANIHARIQLNYGEQYGLRISGVLGEGTVVRAIFPAEKGS